MVQHGVLWKERNYGATLYLRGNVNLTHSFTSQDGSLSVCLSVASTAHQKLKTKA